MKKRRKHTSEFKSKVALEALREREPIHEIAKRYQVHPTQISEWKKTLFAGAGSVFENDTSKVDEAKQHKRKEDRLYKQIGQLQVEVDFLKEACQEFGIGVPQDDLVKLR